MPVSVNPYSLEVIGEYAEHGLKEINEKLETADIAFRHWKGTDFDIRKELLKKLAKHLKENANKYAQTITDEMGKTKNDAVAEVEKCAALCNYYSEELEEFLSPESVGTDYRAASVVFNPLGVILAVMPWNFPFWQAFRAAIPAIAAGNTMVLKHSSNVSGSALFIEEAFEKAGFPKGVFQVLLVAGKEIEKIASNKIIKALTFTGSTEVGRKIGEYAGRNLKKAVLELGGNDPYIVLEDADVELAANKCAISRLINGGQSCISAKRFIVTEKIYEDFLSKFSEIMKDIRYGNPNDSTSRIGPLVSIRARDEIHMTVQNYIRNGAVKLICGGFLPTEKGAFYPATVLEVTDMNKIKDEEIFGPVALVILAKDNAEAIRIANNSNFGLGSAIFSQDIEKAQEIAEDNIEAGSVFINDIVKSDPKLPFGGIKESGYGRELSEFGIREFVNIKTVVTG